MCRSVVFVLLALAACHRAPATTPTRDTTAAVFGDEAWRTPGSIDHIDFVGDRIVVTTDDGSVVAFDRTGARRVLAEDVLPWVSGTGRLGEHALLLAGERPTVVDLRAGTSRPFDAKLEVRRLATAGTRALIGGKTGTPLTVFDLERMTPGIALEQTRHFEEPVIVGDWAVAARPQKTVGIWDLATGKRHRIFGLGNTSAFALSSDHELLAVGTFPGQPHWAVDVYRVEDGTRTATIGFACNPDALAINATSDRLAIACDEEVRVVKLPGGEPVTTLPGTQAYVRTLAWSPKGDLLALGGNDNILHVWSTRDWTRLDHVKGSRGDVRELDVAGRTLVSHAWGDSSAWLWSTETAKPIIELGGPGRDVFATATDANVTLVALTVNGGKEAVIERWRGPARVDHVVLPASTYGLTALVRELGHVAGGGLWYTAGGRLVVLDQRLAQAWALPAPDTDELNPPDGEASATADARRVALYGSQTLTVADAIEQRVVVQAPYPCGGTHAISPDGKRVAFVDDRGVTVLDAETAKLIGSLAFPIEPTGDRAIAWSGTDVVAAVAGSKLVAWTPGAATADVMPAPNTTSLAFSADHVYLGRTDGTVARRSLTALRASATALAVKPAPACDENEDRAGMFGGGSFGTKHRGRLPDDGAYDEDDPAFAPMLFEGVDGD
jgi:hypothetical protein